MTGKSPKAAPANSTQSPTKAGAKTATKAASKAVQKSAAESMYDRLILYIRKFEQQLDGAHEIAMGFAGGEAGVLRIEGLGFFAPDIVTFYGRDDEGAKTQLIQHVAQVSVILRAIRKGEPDAPARRIGFRLSTGWEGGESGDGSV